MTPKQIATLLDPYYPSPTDLLLNQLSQYLDLLLKWNARTNLTAIRDPEEIVRTHFGESLFVARHIGCPILDAAEPSHAGVHPGRFLSDGVEHAVSSEARPSSLTPPLTLLDLGSGAGFPGLPIQLALPQLRVTLAESQAKKSTFLREVIRTLALSTEVWAARVETLPAVRLFDIVTLRAVDDPILALQLALSRTTPNGAIAHLTTTTASINPEDRVLPIPNSQTRILHLIRP